jgi:hypothetical protein
MKRAGALVLVALLAVACIGRPADVTPELQQLAGSWHGRVSGPRGHATAALAIAADGTYTGTIFFQGEDRPFSGRLVPMTSGPLRYLSTEGDGRARVEDREGLQVLRFQRDGGPGGAVFERR